MSGRVSLEYVNCNLCGQDDAKLLFTKRGMRPFTIPFSVVRCQNCGLVYVNPRLSQSLLGELYCEEYFLQRFSNPSDPRIDSATVLARCLKHALVHSNADRPRLLDVGGGIGTYAAAAAAAGFDVHLVDISDAAVAASSALDIACHQGEITDQIFDSRLQSFDAVIALETIEHYYDPMAMLQRTYDLLKPGGVFLYTTGNVLESRLRGKTWSYFNEIPAHVYFYSPDTIRSYLSRVGFTEFIDPYRFIYLQDRAVKILSRYGIIDLKRDTKPESVAARLAYSHLFKWIAIMLGRSRLPFARK